MIWLAVLIFLLVSFTFSGIEAGILSVNRVRLLHRVKNGDHAAIKLDRLLSRPERMLVTVLLVTNLMNIFAIILGTTKIVRIMGEGGYFVSAVVWLPVYLLGLELFPKSLFRRFPYRALAAFAELLRVTDLLFSPVLWLGALIQRFILRETGGGRTKLFAGRNDFKSLISESERAGAITRTEREMIHGIVDFCPVTAEGMMIPLARAQTIPGNATVEELLRLAAPKNLDRLPVVSATGEITGVVDVFEVLLDRTSVGDVSSYQRRVIPVAGTEPAFQALRKMRASRSSMAVVMDPESKPRGILCAEDVVARLVSMPASHP